jgi:hypothetical protein
MPATPNQHMGPAPLAKPLATIPTLDSIRTQSLSSHLAVLLEAARVRMVRHLLCPLLEHKHETSRTQYVINLLIKDSVLLGLEISQPTLLPLTLQLHISTTLMNEKPPTVKDEAAELRREMMKTYDEAVKK